MTDSNANDSFRLMLAPLIADAAAFDGWTDQAVTAAAESAGVDPAAARFLVLGDCNDGKAGKAVQRLLRRGKTEVARLLPAADARGETWTHAYRKEETYSRVDHILVSPGLSASVRGGVARIYGGAEATSASDHRPVVVTLEL